MTVDNIKNNYMTLETEKIEDLFLMMSMKDDDLEQANLAFEEFYRRYGKYLWAICSRVCSNFKGKLDKILSEDVFSNTVQKVYERAETFIDKAESLKTDEEKDVRIKAWLGKIAQNELYAIMRSSLNDDNIIYDSDQLLNLEVAEENTDEKPVASIEKKLLDSALATLKPREREILRAFFMYEEQGKNTPSEILNDLCKLYKTTKDNLRQIKSRSLKKVKNYVEQHNKSRNGKQ